MASMTPPPSFWHLTAMSLRRRMTITVVNIHLIMIVSSSSFVYIPSISAATNSSGRNAILSSDYSSSGSATNNIPAIFLFGDSITDTGNNNRLLTLARADFLPYGENFIDHVPTGRFSDGLLPMDYIANYLGLPLVPPYLDGGDDVWRGVCFASAGTGILDATGEKFGERIALSTQVEYFRRVRGVAVSKLGEEAAALFLARSLHIVATASNDFFSNYDASTASGAAISPSFRSGLLSRFLSHLQDLYELGARKIVVVGVPPLGCVPSIRYTLLKKANSESGGGDRGERPECDDGLNAAVRSYNAALRAAVAAANLTHSYVLYANAFDLALELLANPSAFGLKEVGAACCGWGELGAAAPCLPVLDSSLCSNPSEYMFWDRVHPTSAAYRLIAQRLWQGSAADIYPFNIHHLSLLPLP